MIAPLAFPPLAVLALALAAAPQDPTLAPPPNGPRAARLDHHVLRGVTLHVAPGFELENAAVVFRDGRIAWFGRDPDLAGSDEGRAAGAGAREWRLDGEHVYPAFVDAHVAVDAADSADRGALDRVHFNPLVRPERSAAGGALDAKLAAALRENGFAVAAIAPKRGIFRGSAAVVSLLEPSGERLARVIDPDVYQAVGFDRVRGRGGEEGNLYPDSRMGAIAVVRQVLADAGTLSLNLGESERDGLDHPLRELCADRAALLVFDARDELDVLRAAKIAAEFDRRAAVLGSGLEFRRLTAIAESGLPLIVPLAYPKDPEVGSLAALEALDLRTLIDWEQAPTNPRRLEERGAFTVLTTTDLDDVGDFLPRLRKAIEHGLSPDSALAMLTVRPAELLGLAESLGTLDQGKAANAIVTDGPLFDEETKFRELWIDGVPHVITPRERADLAGRWRVTLVPAIEDEVLLDFDDDGKLTIRSGEAEQKVGKVVRRGALLDFGFEHEPFGEAGVVTIAGAIEGEGDGLLLRGEGLRPDGRRFAWTATRIGDVPPKEEEAEDSDDGDAAEAESDKETDEEVAEESDDAPAVPDLVGLPLGALAVAAPPLPEPFVLVAGATIWTAGPQGVIEDGALLCEDGRITWVGPASEMPTLPDGARRVDAAGRHVTPGLIDCHSHTGIQGGVNESGQAVTAEVRIGDVTDPDAMNWYRQLAGGVTTVNSLHGSANPIGGQNQVNKVRWGVVRPDDMHFAGAPGGIKFALGENVKQSNWGDRFTTRYPQTRMGVETIMRDRFAAAREYAAEWSAYQERMARGGPPPDPPAPRRDLELEALAEILAGERLIHCHSYRQDEILMLCRLAADFGFRIGTFQHVLEGYKVADEIAAVARGGSCFSDWWAYKVEVQDAIPEAGAIMHEQGVVVSFNSDSDELARRMNVEAAKAMKYGGLSAEEALRFVTINPAIQLGVESRVGSLEPGKDADFALWSGPPLSTRSRCVATWIDGAELFSLERDREMRARDAVERQRILQKLLAQGKDDKGDNGGKPAGKGGVSTRREGREERAHDHTERGLCADHHAGDER